MELEKILKHDPRLWDNENLNKTLLFNLLENYDEKILSLLLSDDDLKNSFFIKIENNFVFKYNDFRRYIELREIDGSFTKYAKKIGLTSDGKFLKNSSDYVLEWPFKDATLSGGMSNEDDKDFQIKKEPIKTAPSTDKSSGALDIGGDETTFKQIPTEKKEVFFNNIINKNEIDKLLEKKAFKNFRRFSSAGDEEVNNFNRNDQGFLNENFLVKGNNLIALSSLLDIYAEKITCIYIDPPYNTSNDSFVYNDKFNHSTWLTFMKNRLELAHKLLKEDGVIFISCDDNEQAYLKVLMDEIFKRENFICNFVVTAAPAGTQSASNIAQQHAYCLTYSKTNKFKSKSHPRTNDEIKKKYKDGEDEYGIYETERLWKRGQGGRKEDVPTLHFPVYFDPDTENIYIDDEVKDETKSYEKIIPYHTKGVLGRWTWSRQKMLAEKYKLIVKLTSGEYKLYRKTYSDEDTGRLPYSIITNALIDSKIGRTELGSLEIKEIMGDKVFDYPKFSGLIKYFLETGSDKDSIVLDFFSGSATTAHAVLDLNREDGGNRKFILIEQMNYINTVAKPRVSKVIDILNSDDSFIYCELAEYNFEALKKIDNCKSFKELKNLFSELEEYYFLDYNYSAKKFKDDILSDKDFQNEDLELQKRLFKAVLDNNLLYILYDEQDDPRFNLTKSDRKLTKQLYES